MILSALIVLVLVLVLGCSPILTYYTKDGCFCADTKISGHQPASICQQPEASSRRPVTSRQKPDT